MKEAIKILIFILTGFLFFANLYFMHHFNVQSMSIDKVLFTLFIQVIVSILLLLSIKNLND